MVERQLTPASMDLGVFTPTWLRCDISSCRILVPVSTRLYCFLYVLGRSYSLAIILFVSFLLCPSVSPFIEASQNHTVCRYFGVPYPHLGPFDRWNVHDREYQCDTLWGQFVDLYTKLLNTFTNLGGTWPKYFVLKGSVNRSHAASQF